MLREVREDVGRTAVGKARSPNESAKQSDGRYAVIKVEPRVIVLKSIRLKDFLFAIYNMILR